MQSDIRAWFVVIVVLLRLARYAVLGLDAALLSVAGAKLGAVCVFMGTYPFKPLPLLAFSRITSASVVELFDQYAAFLGLAPLTIKRGFRVVFALEPLVAVARGPSCPPSTAELRADGAEGVNGGEPCGVDDDLLEVSAIGELRESIDMLVPVPV